MEKNNIQSSKTLIITSMHRSGSSLTASLLQSAGLHIGRRLMGAAEANIKGHFENLDFWSLHQKVLKSQGANEEGWTLQDQIQVDDYYREEAKNIVTKNAISGLWGWKDPRTTLFLEFWANLLPEANFLLLFRYPWEVVSSLYRSSQPYAIFQKQPELAIKFWLHYNQKILNFYNNFPDRCFLVAMPTVLGNLDRCLESLNQKFGIELGRPNPTVYDPNLLHRQDSNGHRACLINHYYPEAIALYQELEARAWQLTDAPDTSWQEKLKSSPYRIWAFQDWVKVGNLQGENQKLQQELGQTKSQLHQTQAELGQTQSQLHQTQAELGQTQSQLHQTQEELGQTKSQLHQTQEELGQTKSQLHQTEEKLGQTQSQLEERQTQLYQTEAMLSQYQSHLQQVETLLEQSQTQLHQKIEELEKTQGQLHQTQEELGQTQSQLHQTQAELGQTQSQLHQTQAELGQTQSQLHETEEKLGQTQSQLHQTEEVLEQSQAQLHETEAVLEQSVTQLQQKTQELQQSQSQLHQVQEELERSQSQQQQIKQEEQQAKSELAQTRSKLEEVQTQLYQTEAMLTEYQSHRQQTESALERSLSQLQETRSELERYKTEFERSRLEETLASAAENDEQMQYNLLLWDGWQAYRNGDMEKMAHCLQQSLKFTSLSRTETILNWLENFSRFSSENGYQLDIQELTNLAEWQQLVRRLTAAKSLIAIK
ncbi:sulfotransferase [Planktothricoides raciborskii]|uniref:Sulfotransferase n=1 Tax=Planktothricoides raciborskii FACHB-1370 TaxID=2949576 RepID=A0ABR8EG46_9CYAN|nr:sulfotransferase [Planktothricoides raciborskii]MBD2545829.1 sulfotransferase [Planktothricoides raciborskii FACHB-1370]MBD2583951.1 sulfotransferase [Planktothricoides raciborskii FACHB-1261]